MVAKNSKLDSLGRILRQERTNGFKDTVVIGGLDLFLQRWADELSPILGEPGSYSILTSSQRQKWADSVLPLLVPAADSNAGPVSRRKAANRPTQPKKPNARSKTRPAPTISREDDVIRLKGVSTQNVAKLKRLGVHKVGDLVYLFPHRHNDFANIRKVFQLEPGQEQTIIATVWEASETGQGPRRKSTQAVLGDDTGNVRAIWFNQPWLARTLRSGVHVVISGRVNVFRGQFVFESPEYEVLKGQEQLVHTARLVPVYPSTEGLYQRTLRRIVKQAVDACISREVDFLPKELRHRTGLMGLQGAIAQAHYPDSQADWKAARRRLAFDELFLLQLAALTRKRQWQEAGKGIALEMEDTVLRAFLDSLPFSLTDAQTRVLDEILKDLSDIQPMSRVLQGDVGSGKTVVATAAMLAAAFNGYQAVVMVPTEILAEQHFLTIAHLMAGLDRSVQEEHLVSIEISAIGRRIIIGLLLGSLSRRAKDDIHRLLADGSIDIVVGTQALIQSPVEIPKLALVVVDEQHRFGVMQRAGLREKGERPHLLAMSATPIPRSLALTIYGDLDMSIIDELPPGRLSVQTRWVEPDRRQAAYQFIRKEVAEGYQAFVICPLVEESEAVQSKAAIEEFEKLSGEVFPDLRLGLLHGRMALREKEQVMALFQEGNLDVLVSTPVVEVGIDVPNATVMLIDGADRFGLAQLHQLRGRVGRGHRQSYCLLLAESPGEEARQRLKVLERMQDGFELAEEDLRLRGPGDYLGTRQSGLPSLRVARLTDQDILALARCEATRLLDLDPLLSKAENASLKERFQLYRASLTDEMS